MSFRLLLFTLCSLPFALQAQTGLKLQLVSEVTAITPGQPFSVGLFIQHDKGWHTYWRQPGIVGVPTSIEWTLPEGFTAGPLEYPEPEATKMFQIKAQGFERDVLLQTRITPPASLKPGEKVQLTGKATWMCCGNTCHPGTLDLTLELPVGETSPLNEQWHPIFEKERAAFPQPSEAWTATAEERGMEVTLRLRPQDPCARRFQDAEAVTQVIFFTEDGWINSDEPQKATLEADGTLRLTLRRADVFLGKDVPAKLHGIVQRPGGWHQDGSLRSLIISPALSR